MQRSTLPRYNEFLRELNSDNVIGEYGIESFIDKSRSSLRHIRKAINLIHAYHIWFTEVVPEFAKQLTEKQLEYVSCFTVTYKNGVAEFQLTYNFRVNAFDEIELKNFNAGRHKFVITEKSKKRVVITSNIIKLY